MRQIKQNTYFQECKTVKVYNEPLLPPLIPVDIMDHRNGDGVVSKSISTVTPY